MASLSLASLGMLAVVWSSDVVAAVWWHGFFQAASDRGWRGGTCNPTPRQQASLSSLLNYSSWEPITTLLARDFQGLHSTGFQSRSNLHTHSRAYMHLPRDQFSRSISTLHHTKVVSHWSRQLGMK